MVERLQWTLLCATQVPSQDPGSPRGQQCWLLLAQLLFIKGSRLTRRLERHAGFGIKGLALLPPGFPGGSDGKESTYKAGDLGLIPGLGKSPGGGYGNPLQYFCLENPHGERSLAGYSPWGCKESDTTE